MFTCNCNNVCDTVTIGETIVPICNECIQQHILTRENAKYGTVSAYYPIAEIASILIDLKNEVRELRESKTPTYKSMDDEEELSRCSSSRYNKLMKLPLSTLKTTCKTNGYRGFSKYTKKDDLVLFMLEKEQSN